MFKYLRQQCCSHTNTKEVQVSTVTHLPGKYLSWNHYRFNAKATVCQNCDRVMCEHRVQTVHKRAWYRFADWLNWNIFTPACRGLETKKPVVYLCFKCDSCGLYRRG